MSEIKRFIDYARSSVGTMWDRIQEIERSDAARELDESISPGPEGIRRSPADARETARKILGVGPSDDMAVIQAAHDRLMERSDPSRFPEGSPERAQAEAIRLRVRRAFATLTAELDGTERRFRTLEL